MSSRYPKHITCSERMHWLFHDAGGVPEDELPERAFDGIMLAVERDPSGGNHPRWARALVLRIHANLDTPEGCELGHWAHAEPAPKDHAPRLRR